MKFASRPRRRILQEAAIWQALLEQSPSAENHAKFQTWLTKSRQHVEIYLYVAVRFPKLLDTQPVTPTLASHDPIPFDKVGPFVWVSAIGVVAILAAGGWAHWHTHQVAAPLIGTVYEDEGSFPLEGDSVMTLRNGSRVTVFHSIDPTGTTVEVDKGYAGFTGTHNSANPLRVVSGNVVADPLGTTFDVLRKQASTTVNVTGGQVSVSLSCPAVDRGAAAPTKAVLTNSQYVEISGDNCFGPILVKSADEAPVKQRVLSDSDWLDFAEKTILEAAEQLNQYNVDRERIVVRSTTLGNQLIGGRFHPSDVDSFLMVLKRNYNVKITRHTEQDGSKVIYLDLATGK